MKRLMIILIMTLAAMTVVKAQIVRTDRGLIRWGVKASVDLNLATKWHTDAGNVKMYKRGAGFQIIGAGNISLGKNFFLEPGVSLFFDQYRYDDIYLEFNSKKINPTITKFGIRIPINIGYAIPIREAELWVYTGPELSWAIIDKVNCSTPIEDAKIEDFLTRPKNFDFGWKVGLGLPIHSWLISFDATFGLLNMNRSSSISYRENRLALSLGYYF